MLKIENVSYKYGSHRALYRVSLYIKKGEVVTLIGPNGAGKTTLLHLISGIIEPKKGKIFFEGEDITGMSISKIVKKGIIQVPEGRRIFPDQTVLDNLILGGYIRRKEKKKIFRDLETMYELFPILKERKNQKAGSLSGGEQQMLSIARALLAKPKLLMLDEPSMGLAQNMIYSIYEKLKELNRQGLTIFLVEQNLKLSLSIAHRGYLIKNGWIVTEGEANKLIDDEVVKAQYLGHL
ncbi:MAG: ABC transporter ATP-binding protein [Deltaproteobacteria bacterium]|nr:MAG: ABC transporter ATP-binding protein [Deltaproteobacteria bacterium]